MPKQPLKTLILNGTEIREAYSNANCLSGKCHTCTISIRWNRLNSGRGGYLNINMKMMLRPEIFLLIGRGDKAKIVLSVFLSLDEMFQ
jgi:hypothetical protein